jgi:hypothetical protein
MICERPDCQHPAKVRFTKPCGRHGCTGTVIRKTRYDLTRAANCSKRCAMLVRMANGYQVPRVPLEARLRGGKKGGLAASAKRRTKRKAAAMALLERSIPATVRDGWTHQQLTVMRALMSLAFEKGQAIERVRIKSARFQGRAA